MLARQDMVVRQTRSILELEKTQNSGEKERTQWRKGRKHSGETQDTVDSGERNKTQWRKSRGLKKATNVGRGRYGGPPNKEGDFQANRTLQIGLIHTLPLHVTHAPARSIKISNENQGIKIATGRHTAGFNQPKEDSSSALLEARGRVA